MYFIPFQVLICHTLFCHPVALNYCVLFSSLNTVLYLVDLYFNLVVCYTSFEFFLFYSYSLLHAYHRPFSSPRR